MPSRIDPQIQQALQQGLVIPACPLALTPQRKFDERRQRAVIRYYTAAGAGGLAVGVHTTQFKIREHSAGLFRSLLELASEEMGRQEARHKKRLVRIAGVCGGTKQAAAEAALVADLQFNAGLLSLAALKDAGEEELLAHARTIAEIIPLVGFYLQPAVGGLILPYSFWRRFVEIENVIALKIAPFNRYQTVEVMRAVADSGRRDIALYTGNDDNIVMDLLTPFKFQAGNRQLEWRMVGGLLGHWAVWTQKAVELLAACHRLAQSGRTVPQDMLQRAVEITDANGAFFDSAHGYAGCIPGLHEVLRRQGLFEGTWCLDPKETLSPGQLEEIDRVYRAYPHLNDDSFVATHLQEWLTS